MTEQQTTDPMSRGEPERVPIRRVHEKTETALPDLRPAPKLSTPTARPVRKLRMGAAVGTLAALMLPLVNSLLAKRGLPSVTAQDVESIWDLGLAAYGSAAAVVAWVAAYLARPSASDTPVEVR
jgi:hypothetical protein